MEATTTEINGKIRETGGKKANQRLRAEGWLPGIIYGHKQNPVAVLLPGKELYTALHNGAHVLTVNLGGSSEQVLVKEVQYDHLSQNMIHVDLTRVDLTERVEVSVEIILRGTPKGATDGGVLDQTLSEMDVECVVTQIPESVRVNVAELGLGQALHIKDVPLPDGVKALGDPDTVVCVCRVLGEELEAAAEEAEGGAMEPEVISRGKAEEEEGEE